jgi:hypothetical protein
VKILFICFAVLSIVLGLFSMGTWVAGITHNHYQSRYFFLSDSRWQDHSPSWWELSEAEVSKQPEKFAIAYRESVQDAYKLGSLSDSLRCQCVFLAAILFIVSCIGWFAARRYLR